MTPVQVFNERSFPYTTERFWCLGRSDPWFEMVCRAFQLSGYWEDLEEKAQRHRDRPGQRATGAIKGLLRNVRVTEEDREKMRPRNRGTY
jgi:hypothetical protein